MHNEQACQTALGTIEWCLSGKNRDVSAKTLVLTCQWLAHTLPSCPYGSSPLASSICRSAALLIAFLQSGDTFDVETKILCWGCVLVIAQEGLDRLPDGPGHSRQLAADMAFSLVMSDHAFPRMLDVLRLSLLRSAILKAEHHGIAVRVVATLASVISGAPKDIEALVPMNQHGRARMQADVTHESMMLLVALADQNKKILLAADGGRLQEAAGYQITRWILQNSLDLGSTGVALRMALFFAPDNSNSAKIDCLEPALELICEQSSNLYHEAGQSSGAAANSSALPPPGPSAQSMSLQACVAQLLSTPASMRALCEILALSSARRVSQAVRLWAMLVKLGGPSLLEPCSIDSAAIESSAGPIGDSKVRVQRYRTSLAAVSAQLSSPSQAASSATLLDLLCAALLAAVHDHPSPAVRTAAVRAWRNVGALVTHRVLENGLPSMQAHGEGGGLAEPASQLLRWVFEMPGLMIQPCASSPWPDSVAIELRDALSDTIQAMSSALPASLAPPAVTRSSSAGSAGGGDGAAAAAAGAGAFSLASFAPGQSVQELDTQPWDEIDEDDG